MSLWVPINRKLQYRDRQCCGDTGKQNTLIVLISHYSCLLSIHITGKLSFRMYNPPVIQQCPPSLNLLPMCAGEDVSCMLKFVVRFLTNLLPCWKTLVVLLLHRNLSLLGPNLLRRRCQWGKGSICLSTCCYLGLCIILCIRTQQLGCSS